MKKLYTIFFSATDTTRKCVEKVCAGLGMKPVSELNLADNLKTELPEFMADDIVVIGVPVYGGRVPTVVADVLSHLKGNGAAALALVVYGNRDYDDALLELTDVLTDRDFHVVGAGAFIGQHSIFPKVGASRPDFSDEQCLIRFGKECMNAISKDHCASEVPYIKGKKPYKQLAGIVLAPVAKEQDCVKCGACVRKCPVGAISSETPWITDTAKCISCGRCITLCSQNARKHTGLKYSIFGAIFKACFSKRKEPEWTVVK
ncbi:MAG: 4Fe-4S binding protein [Clostridiales bacterium]|nr:4Fe-4S binding protein [Clostridiales bacterium]